MAGQPQQTGPTRTEWEELKSAVPIVDGGFAEENASQLMTRCQMLSQSDALGDSYRDKPANIMVANEMAIALGVKLGIMLQNSFVHKGRINPMCYLLLGVCQKSPVFDHKAYKVWTSGVKHEDEDGGVRYENDYTWHCKMGRIGGETMEFTYSVAMAKTAKLWDKKSKHGDPLPWKLHPEDMGSKMPIARAMRKMFSDLTMGLVTAEEMVQAKAVDDLVDSFALSDEKQLEHDLTTAPDPDPEPPAEEPVPDAPKATPPTPEHEPTYVPDLQPEPEPEPKPEATPPDVVDKQHGEMMVTFSKLGLEVKTELRAKHHVTMFGAVRELPAKLRNAAYADVAAAMDLQDAEKSDG